MLFFKGISKYFIKSSRPVAPVTDFEDNNTPTKSVEQSPSGSPFSSGIFSGSPQLINSTTTPNSTSILIRPQVERASAFSNYTPIQPKVTQLSSLTPSVSPPGIKFNSTVIEFTDSKPAAERCFSPVSILPVKFNSSSRAMEAASPDPDKKTEISHVQSAFTKPSKSSLSLLQKGRLTKSVGCLPGLNSPLEGSPSTSPKSIRKSSNADTFKVKEHSFNN